ncbi:MAG: MerC domain-containing protein, partial [Bacteroidota bacterium]
MDITQNSSYSNLLGAAASGLCAIHCAVTPLIFAAKPLLEHAHGEHGHAHGSAWWGAFDYIFLALSFIAVWYSVRNTNHTVLKRVLWVSWGVFALGIMFEAFHLPYGHWLMYGGSIALIVGHLLNY